MMVRDNDIWILKWVCVHVLVCLRMYMCLVQGSASIPNKFCFNLLTISLVVKTVIYCFRCYSGIV